RSITSTRWRAAAVVGVLLVAAWWIVPAVLQHGARAEGTQSATSHEAAATHESGAHAGEESGPQKFPNFITVLARAFPDAEWAHFLHQNEAVVFSLLVAFLLCLFCFIATRSPQMIPKPLQNALELVVEGLRDFIVGIIGEKHADRFV